MNQKLPGIQAGFRKGRGTREQIANIHWIIEKAREFQKNIYLRFINYAKALDCGDHNKQWKALKKMGIPDHHTCLLRNLYAAQEATVRILYGTIDWFMIEKGVRHGCLLSPCLFNLYAEHVMRNVGLDELQARIKIGGRNNNLKYGNDSTLMAESEEELKNLLIRVEESERAGLKLNIKKTKIMTTRTVTSCQVEGEKVEVVTDFLFLALKLLRMVTVPIKSEDDCFLAGKL